MKSFLKIFFFISIVSNIDAQDFPDEKIFLQIDKNCYSTGDSVHFQLNLFSSTSQKSNIVYVELISPTLSLIDERILKIDTKTICFLKIPISADTGKYFIRAYTKYLTGFNSNSFFHKPIFVEKSQRIKKKELKIGIEGGNLVLGLPSKIALKTELKNQKFSIIDEKGGIVSDFQSDEYGIAITQFVPTKEQSYFLEINHEEYQNQKFLIGKTKISGTTISISQKDTLIALKVFTSQVKTDSLTLVIKQMSELAGIYRIKKNTVNLYNFSTKILSKGLINFEIVDDSNKVLTQRVWYNSEDDYLAEKNIFQRFWDIDYYLDEPISENTNKTKILNNYLITSTLKYFKLNNLFEKEEGLTRSGTARNIRNELFKNDNLLVFANAKSIGVQKIQTDSLGSFSIKNIREEGLIEAKIQDFDEKPLNITWLPREIPAYEEESIENAAISKSGVDMPFIDAKQLDEVVVKAKRNIEKAKNALAIRYFYPDYSIDTKTLLEKSNGSGDLMMAIGNCIAGIIIKSDSKTGIKEAFLLRDQKNPIIVNVDGQNTSYNILPNIENIYKVEVLRKNGIGAIYIYTKTFMERFIDENKIFDGNTILKGFDNCSEK